MMQLQLQHYSQTICQQQCISSQRSASARTLTVAAADLAQSTCQPAVLMGMPHYEQVHASYLLMVPSPDANGKLNLLRHLLRCRSGTAAALGMSASLGEPLPASTARINSDAFFQVISQRLPSDADTCASCKVLIRNISRHDGSDVKVRLSAQQCPHSMPQDEEDANFTLDDGQAVAPPSAPTSAPAAGQVWLVPMAAHWFGLLIIRGTTAARSVNAVLTMRSATWHTVGGGACGTGQGG